MNRQTSTLQTGEHNGAKGFYPASVVKLFYLAYAHRQLEDRKIKMSPELERAIKDMIVDSINDATGLVLETITGTTGGPELSKSELARWMEKRQVVNRWIKSLGYEGVNACQKTWNEGPYGRERQGYGPHFELRNSLTTHATARLMVEIMLGRIVSPARSQAMADLLRRKIPADAKDADGQSTDFIGAILPKGSELRSKAGWTETVRHDVAYIKLPNGQELVMCIFSNKLIATPEVLHALARRLLAGIQKL